MKCLSRDPLACEYNWDSSLHSLGSVPSASNYDATSKWPVKPVEKGV